MCRGVIAGGRGGGVGGRWDLTNKVGGWLEGVGGTTPGDRYLPLLANSAKPPSARKQKRENKKKQARQLGR